MSKDMMPQRWFRVYDTGWVKDCAGEWVKSEDVEPLVAEITRLRAENIHLRRAGMDRPSAELHEAALAELRAEITRYRAGLQRIVEGDGFWDAPSLASDLLEGKDVT